LIVFALAGDSTITTSMRDSAAYERRDTATSPRQLDGAVSSVNPLASEWRDSGVYTGILATRAPVCDVWNRPGPRDVSKRSGWADLGELGGERLMRIAQVAPLAEAVPPKLYGGTERVVATLTDQLVRDGHAVTLFASGDSRTSAKLVPCAPRGLRLAGMRDHTASLLVMLDKVHQRADEFDIIHFHVDLLQFPMFQDLASKCVTTTHGRLDLPDFHPVYRTFPKMPLVSISDAQRKPMPPGLNWRATIHHGLPPNAIPFQPTRGDYLAFLGRISP
jgi:hypothetical protein